MKHRLFLWSAAFLLATLTLQVPPALAQKYGGILHAMHRSNPASLSIHEESSINTTWPIVPVYSNLVRHDAAQAQETMATIVPELAEQWFWGKGGTTLTFRLRRGVRFHDGRPLTSKDVVHTFNLVRGISEQKLKLNPRKLWYGNVKDITSNGDYEVTFHLERPQPALLVMLAGAHAAIYPSHMTPQELRINAVGTGPFRLKEYNRDQSIVLEKNPDYFIKGRPYLDGIVFSVIKAQATRTAAFIAGQLDLSMPAETPEPVYNQLKASGKNFVYHRLTTNATDNIIVNTKKPPFDNEQLRHAINLAMDRRSYIKSVLQGGGVPGGALPPPPLSVWGLPEQELNKLPGYGDPVRDKAEARRIMQSLGYGPDKHLEITMSTRTASIYRNGAVWAISQLKEIWIDAKLEEIETGVWYGKVARRDFTLGFNLTAWGPDDPDATLYENYTCDSERNYSDYCNPELEKLFDRQSMETDVKKRLQMVHEIDRKLTLDVARPMMVHRVDYYAAWPHVMNFVPHQTIYTVWRFQDVWLDK
jgi:peptide/nickel transport system substrate-binding protein